MVGGGVVAPSVVNVGDKLGSCAVVYGHHVALEILFEEIGLENIRGIVGIAVAVANGRTGEAAGAKPPPTLASAWVNHSTVP